MRRLCRKLYKEFFYVPKYGKVREKVMVTRVATTLTVMIMCLAAMSITAYAFFSYNITSGASTIKVANFETQITVQLADNHGRAVNNSQITPITSDHKCFRVEGLEAGKFYTVTITHTPNSTAKTGFMVVTADNCPDTYHTQQLAKDVNAEDGRTSAVSFKLKITDTSNVHFLAHWGTSSYYDAYKENGDQEELYITQNEEITMIINPATEPDSSEPTNAGSNTENTEPTSATPPVQTITVMEPSTGATTVTEPSATQIPTATTLPEATGTSEPVSTTQTSAPTTEATTVPTTDATTASTTAPITESTASTETSAAEETEQNQSTEATEATEFAEVTEATDVPATEMNNA